MVMFTQKPKFTNVVFYEGLIESEEKGITCKFVPDEPFIREWVDLGYLIFDDSDEKLYLVSSTDEDIAIEIEPGDFFGYKLGSQERFITDIEELQNSYNPIEGGNGQDFLNLYLSKCKE